MIASPQELHAAVGELTGQIAGAEHLPRHRRGSDNGSLRRCRFGGRAEELALDLKKSRVADWNRRAALIDDCQGLIRQRKTRIEVCLVEWRRVGDVIDREDGRFSR